MEYRVKGSSPARLTRIRSFEIQLIPSVYDGGAISGESVHSGPLPKSFVYGSGEGPDSASLANVLGQRADHDYREETQNSRTQSLR